MRMNTYRKSLLTVIVLVLIGLAVYYWWYLPSYEPHTDGTLVKQMEGYAKQWNM